MPPVRVIMAAPETATGPRAEFWVGDERLAETVLYDGRLHLRFEPRPAGEPLLIEAASLALALDDAARQILGY
jgi:hypothetical protein